MRALLAAILLIGCGSTWEPGTSESALQTCSSNHWLRSVDVTLTDGSCGRITLPPAPTFAEYRYTPAGIIARIDTGPGAAAWACDQSLPAGAPGAPCWSSSTNNGVRRARGPYASGMYQAGSRVINDIVGRSAVLSLGLLLQPGPPACPYQLGIGSPPTHWHACGTTSDYGLPDYTANNDPTDSTTCCQISANWPSGLAGSPCIVNDAPGVGYATVHYQCPVY